MGNDGGVIAVKRKFMRHGKKKQPLEKLNPETLKLKQSTTCALTDEPLKEPIVACEYGNLYNKISLIERLLDHSLPISFSHIRSLKDVITCNITYNNTESTLLKLESSTNGMATVPRISCPVSMIELNGKVPFVVLRSCGCIMSERAIKEVKSANCLVCTKPFDASWDIITLFPPLEDYPKISEKILAHRETFKKPQKEKKVKDRKEKSDKRKRREEKEKNGVTSSSNSFTTTKKNKVVVDAMKSIEEGKSKSNVYASLFSDGKEKKKNANDLLMTIGSLRYTLS